MTGREGTGGQGRRERGSGMRGLQVPGAPHRQKASLLFITHQRFVVVADTIDKCKKLQFIHKLTASDTSKTAKITKR